MYSLEFKMSVVKLYFQLKKNNIIGENRINIIYNTFSNKFHINSLYNWIKNINCCKRKYYKITDVIEKFIIDKITKNKIISSKNIKFLIKNKFNVELSKTAIYSIYKKK